MESTTFPIHFAPLQGYTDAEYRQAHARYFGGIESYYSPFVRVEHGELRTKDIRDIAPENNRGVCLIPQLIAPNTEKLKQIMTAFQQYGYRKVDINLGCPFPMLAKRHNGSGMLPYPEEVKALLSTAIEEYPMLEFSVKLRLGWEKADDAIALLPFLNELPLTHLILHPRIGKQQYKGEVDLKAFQAFYENCRHPLFYNGDLLTIDDINRITGLFPKLAGIMIGRGLLANPALALEFQQGKILSKKELAERVDALHQDVFSQYENRLQGGDLQLLNKMKSFWEYLLPQADRKAKKAIHKANRLDTYQTAVQTLIRELKQ